MARKQAAAATLEPQQASDAGAPTCPICSAKRGEPVEMRVALGRREGDLYHCPTPGCRFMRQLPARPTIEAIPQVRCPWSHDWLPAAAAEVDEERQPLCIIDPARPPEGATVYLKCPHEGCNFKTVVNARRRPG